ncbi:hypothetical protein G9A89_006004 [Geosiphon pyriformis]|nr:hypothetical protein G9A89_006004 [Geosiphon pyriformis]
MAFWANIAYCIPKAKASISSPEFIGDVSYHPEVSMIYGYFGGNFWKGPKITKTQLETTKFQMTKLRANGYFKVDLNWWNMFKDQYIRALIAKIRHGIDEIRNRMGSKQLIDIFLTGHRVGGFYAQILGFLLLGFLALDENVYIHVVTFGSPRPGDYQLAKQINIGFPSPGNHQFSEQINKRSNKLNIYRVTHTNELFPHFPKYSVTGVQYIHPGTEYWIADIDCDCNEPIVYECPGFSKKSQKKYGESLQCNLETDGTGTSTHDTPYFGTIFEDCTNYLNGPNFFPTN